VFAARDSAVDDDCWFKFNSPSVNATTVQLHVNASLATIQLYKPKDGAFLITELTHLSEIKRNSLEKFRN